MSHRILVFFVCLCVMLSFDGQCYAQGHESEFDDSGSASSATQEFFSKMQMIGDSYNASGTQGASSALLDAGCAGIVEQLAKSEYYEGLGYRLNTPYASLNEVYKNQSDAAKTRILNSLCAALRGEDVASFDPVGEGESLLRGSVIPMAAMSLKNTGERYGLPFLPRLELEVGASNNSFINSVTTVQPLWEDATDHHHVFTQLSWYNAPDEKDDGGLKKEVDTVNAGLAYRYLSDDKTKLYGANVFFDHAPREDHNRMSVGVDARTSQASVSANKYFPLSGYRSQDDYYESKAAGGWDLEFSGQTPSLPSWTASVKGYEWDNQDKGDDLYGAETAVEYSPVPALSVRAGVRDESQDAPSFEAALNFRWRFDQPAELQWRPRTALTPVAEQVYEKVERSNLIRTQNRRKESSKLTVIDTIGANSAVDSAGQSTLSSGQVLLMPVTVTVANTAGALARLRTAKGGIITIAQNSSVRVEPTVITLISGTLQYVSDGVIQTVVVPGGTIDLHGTDIDVVSNGVNSSVRVRDGNVTFDGVVSGAASLDAGEMAQSVSGVIGTLASGSADYIAHADSVNTLIERVAPPLEGEKVAPYTIESPRIVSAGTGIGQSIVFGLKFNGEVTVSGGTPRLNFTINGLSRTANLTSGSGTNDLVFTYTIQASDSGATSLTVTGFDNNGAQVTGNGKTAVTTIADATLSLSVADLIEPSGYGAAFTSDPVNSANVTAGAFNITSAEIGATYNYTISSSGGGTAVTGTGTVASATQSVTGITLSGLGDGTLTVSVTLTDAGANVGTAATDTVVKDTVAPTISSVSAPSDGTYEP